MKNNFIKILALTCIVFFAVKANAQNHKSSTSSYNEGLPMNRTAFLFCYNSISSYKNPAVEVFNTKSKTTSVTKNLSEENSSTNNKTQALPYEKVCMFPNNTEDELWVQLNDKTKEEQNLNVEIYNESGDRIYNSRISENLHKINLCEFSTGTFLVKLGDAVQKLVIE